MTSLTRIGAILLIAMALGFGAVSAVQAHGTGGERQADLILTKTLLSKEPLFAGDMAIWKMKLTNNGPDAATDIVVTENLGELTLVEDGAVASQGNFADLKWTIPELASRQFATLTLKTTIPEDAEKGKLKNCVTIKSPAQDDTETGSSEVCASATIMGPPLVLTKTLLSKGPLFTGAPVVWKIKLVNNGDSAVEEIKVTEFPTGIGEFTLDGAVASQGNFAGLVWTIPELASRQFATLTLTTTIAEAGKKKNCVEITSPAQDDTGTAGSEVCASATIISPSLVLTKTLQTKGPLFPGDQAVWKMKLTNNGPDAATDLEVTENLGELTLVEDGAVASQGNFADLKWTIPELASRQFATLTLKTTIPEDAEEGEELKNCVSITSPAQDDTGTDTGGSEVCASITIIGSSTTAVITIKPKTLNLRSRGFFTVFIRFGDDIPLSEINLKESTLVCNGAEAKKLKVSQKDGGTVIAKFRRQELDDNVVAGEEITITCEGTFSIGDEIVKVTGSDTIRVIGEKKKGFDRFLCDVLDTVLPTTEDDGEDVALDQTATTAQPTTNPQDTLNRGQLQKAARSSDTGCTEDCNAADSQDPRGNGKKSGTDDQNKVTGSSGKENQGKGNGNTADTGNGNGNGKGNSNKPDTEKGNGKNKK